MGNPLDWQNALVSHSALIQISEALVFFVLPVYFRERAAHHPFIGRQQNKIILYT